MSKNLAPRSTARPVAEWEVVQIDTVRVVIENSGHAYTRASQDFLRRLDEAELIVPLRSAGGHRRYSRYQLRLAARAREMVDHGTALEAACRIGILEDQLEEALQHNRNRQRRRRAGAT